MAEEGHGIICLRYMDAFQLQIMYVQRKDDIQEGPRYVFHVYMWPSRRYV